MGSSYNRNTSMLQKRGADDDGCDIESYGDILYGDVRASTTTGTYVPSPALHHNFTVVSIPQTIRYQFLLYTRW